MPSDAACFMHVVSILQAPASTYILCRNDCSRGAKHCGCSCFHTGRRSGGLESAWNMPCPVACAGGHETRPFQGQMSVQGMHDENYTLRASGSAPGSAVQVSQKVGTIVRETSAFAMYMLSNDTVAKGPPTASKRGGKSKMSRPTRRETEPGFGIFPAESS
jgi:hypothetical protein